MDMDGGKPIFLLLHASFYYDISLIDYCNIALLV